MGWGAEQIALAVVGALFFVLVVASLHPRVALSLASRIVLATATGVFVTRGAVASHAATPANVLSWRASHGDVAVVAAIASRQGSGNTTANDG